MNYTYILECVDGSYYTGWTVDLEKRIKLHNSGKGAKYTKSHRPVKLVYYECYEDRHEAMRREYAIKQLSRKQKEKLVMTSSKHDLQYLHSLCDDQHSDKLDE